MRSNNVPLESILEKPSWKQWIPIYGIYEIYRAQYVTRTPAVTDGVDLTLVWQGSLVLHATSLLGATYGLTKLAEKLI